MIPAEVTAFFTQHRELGDLLLVALLFLTAWLAHAAARFVLLRAARALAARTKADWDDILVRHRLFRRLALYAPALVVTWALRAHPEILHGLAPLLKQAVSVWLAIVTSLVASSLLFAGEDVYARLPIARRRPLTGIAQLLRIFVYIMGGAAALALALGESPWALLSGIGALSAVVLLVFRDTILSFVAGLQLSAGDLLRPGDWLEMPDFGADGEVLDIALHTVRVRNWDMTIVSIPTYKLMENSFKNWRGMTESGGRRIKRAILIDLSSVRFVDQTLLERFQRVDRLREHLSDKQRDVEAWNAEHGAHTETSPLNGRRLTNLGCFRAYARTYVSAHPAVRHDMTLMVRQLAPTDRGLPLEIYCFLSQTEWVAYEGIQADIFDHLLAALPWFGLRVYQREQSLDGRAAEFARADPADEGPDAPDSPNAPNTLDTSDTPDDGRPLPPSGPRGGAGAGA